MLQELEIDINSDPPSKEEVEQARSEWFAVDEKIWRAQNMERRIMNVLLPAEFVVFVAFVLLLKLELISLYWAIPFTILGGIQWAWFNYRATPQLLDLDWILPLQEQELGELNAMLGRSDVVDCYVSKVNTMSREFIYKEYLAIKAHLE